jgi:hypothetical protein
MPQPSGRAAGIAAAESVAIAQQPQAMLKHICKMPTHSMYVAKCSMSVLPGRTSSASPAPAFCRNVSGWPRPHCSGSLLLSLTENHPVSARTAVEKIENRESSL